MKKIIVISFLVVSVFVTYFLMPLHGAPEEFTRKITTEYIDFTVYTTSGLPYAMQWCRPRDENWKLEHGWCQSYSGTGVLHIIEAGSNDNWTTYTTNIIMNVSSNSGSATNWIDNTWNTGNKLGYRWIEGTETQQCSLGIKITL